jgi:hypothetical protein
MFDFTICLHCGCSQEVVNAQKLSLAPLEKKYNILWNNRIDRFPHMYPTYSELINHSVASSETETVILINDRCSPKPEEVEKILNLLNNGFACVLLYNVGFMGFTKDLVRKIGWWDQRFIQGWEDRDWVWRIKEADLALYESQEAQYDYSWRSPLNHPTGKCEEDHFKKKWSFVQNGILHRQLPEEKYPEWDKYIEYKEPQAYMHWNQSILNVDFDKPNSGASASSMVKGRVIL